MNLTISDLPKDVVSLILKDIEIEDIKSLRATSKNVSKLISQNPKFLLYQGLIEGNKKKIEDNLKNSKLKLLEIIQFIIRKKEVTPETLKFLLSVSNMRLTFKIVDQIITDLYNDNSVKKWINLKPKKEQDLAEFEDKIIDSIIQVIKFLLKNEKISKGQCSKLRQMLCELKNNKERSENDKRKIMSMETLIDLSMLPKKDLKKWKEELIVSYYENIM
jgi:hypothetical protein